MSAHTPIHVDFVTEEYAEKLDRFAAGRGVSREAAERAFRRHCEELRSNLTDGTPGGVIRRIAFHKLEWAPPSETRASEDERGVAAGTDGGSSGVPEQ